MCLSWQIQNHWLLVSHRFFLLVRSRFFGLRLPGRIHNQFTCCSLQIIYDELRNNYKTKSENISSSWGKSYHIRVMQSSHCLNSHLNNVCSTQYSHVLLAASTYRGVSQWDAINVSWSHRLTPLFPTQYSHVLPAASTYRGVSQGDAINVSWSHRLTPLFPTQYSHVLLAASTYRGVSQWDAINVSWSHRLTPLFPTQYSHLLLAASTYRGISQCDAINVSWSHRLTPLFPINITSYCTVG